MDGESQNARGSIDEGNASLRRGHSVVSRSPLLDQAARSAWGLLQRAVRDRKLRRYLASVDEIRLMLGAGPVKRPGWLATDLTPLRADVMLLDVSKPFPFNDDSVALIHTEHVIEHISYDVGQHMIRECARVLRPRGCLRISTPDFDRVVALADPNLDARVAVMMRDANVRQGVSSSRLADPCFSVNRLFSEFGHRFLYSEALLTRCLLEGGFREVARCAVGESDDPALRDLEMHGERIGSDWNAYQSLILEARV